MFYYVILYSCYWFGNPCGASDTVQGFLYLQRRVRRKPNSRCCPVCTGMPGTLPVINQKAVEYAVKAGMALGCDISKFSSFDRKNYFYPDLPKAYQISELYYPLCLEGKVAIDTPNGQKYIRINHIHLEEDAGKLVHDDFNGVSLADYNRCGIPLIEIVTEPDISSAEEAKAFVEKSACCCNMPVYVTVRWSRVRCVAMSTSL